MTMKRLDLQSTRRPSVTLLITDELIRPGRAQFKALPTIRSLWRGYEPLILAKPQPSKTLQTKHHHLTVGSLGAGRFIKPVEELIAWTIERGRLSYNPVLRSALAKTALLNRPCHLIFFDEPRELVFHAVVAIANMAAAHGIDGVKLHPVGASAETVDAITRHARGARPGRLSDIVNFDTVIFVNVAPYTNEQWLEQFLQARPDLTETRAVVLVGESSAGSRYVHAFPPTSYDGTLAQAILGAERSQRWVVPTSQRPHFPYYFDGLRTMQLGVTEDVFESADDLAQAFDRALGQPHHFNLFSIDSQMVKLSTLDRLIGKFAAPYIKSGGALLLLSGAHDPGTMLSGVMADRALGRDLVSAALSDDYGLGSVGRPQGTICDVAPTVLKLLGLPIPYQMMGKPLV